MPFLRRSTKHRQTSPYGPGAGFAIGSCERLAARRREAAQMKAFMRRYPNILPQAMNVVAGGLFRNPQSAEHTNGFGGVRPAASFDQFEENVWEDPATPLPHPFLRNQFQSSFAFSSFGGPAFGRQPQSFWPGGGLREGIPRSQGMHWLMRDEVFLEELYNQRQSEDGYIDAYSGLGPRPFPHSFDEYQRGGLGPQQNEPFDDHSYHGFRAGRYSTPLSMPFDDQPDRAGRFDPFRSLPHSCRGSPRDSYERLRPEDL